MNDKRCTVAQAGAFGADGSAVKLDELLDDGQAKPQAAVAASGGGVGLSEAVEDMREKFGANAFAVVDDADLDVLGGAVDEHLHGAAARREFNSI